MSYHIEINEYQRRLIMKALTSTDVNQFSQAQGSGDAFDTEAKELANGAARKAHERDKRALELRNVVAKYPFERSRGFPGSEPNSGQGDHSRLSCSAVDTQLGAGFCRRFRARRGFRGWRSYGRRVRWRPHGWRSHGRVRRRSHGR